MASSSQPPAEVAADDRLRGLPKKTIAAIHRASGSTQETACGHAGIGLRTIRRWENKPDPDYWAAYNEAWVTFKRDGYAEAWATLRQGLRSRDDNIAIRAASKIVDVVDRAEPQRHEHTGADLGPIEIVVERPVLPEGEAEE